jgi:hypothetical protein
VNELFPIESVTQDSPRLAWLKRHNLETECIPEGGPGVESPETGEDIPAWICRVRKQHPNFSTYCDREIGGGNTEDDAIADFARNAGIPLWNEESLAADLTHVSAARTPASQPAGKERTAERVRQPDARP